MSKSPITIRRISPTLPAFVELTAELDAYQQTLYPPESNHLDSIERLVDEDAVVMGAFDGDDCIGCGALKVTGTAGELKRMYVPPRARGRGVAQQLLAQLEHAAREAGLAIVRLETGIHQHAAIKLYRSAGYETCGPFGDYPDDPLSVYMQKSMRAMSA
ncbi:MAG: GNAT family N-acetyltransferase [Pseudomonadota bacterium]